MIDKVIKFIEKPQLLKEEAFIEQEEEGFKKYIDQIENKNEDQNLEAKEAEITETTFLEKSINKIGVLLGVGLGDAGSELINNYLNKETNILNIANNTEAIFGFCDIRNFTDATEVLQEEVMLFVNSIADIVHSIAD